MKKLKTMKSLSLMSPKPIGLFLFKKRDILSFSEMILQRANPIRLGIQNDTVRFFLKQQEVEKSVVHHQHLHKQDIQNTYASNNKNLSNTKNLKVRDVLYMQEGNSTTQTYLDNTHYRLNENFNINHLSNKTVTLADTKVSNSKFYKSFNPLLDCIQNSVESETFLTNKTKLTVVNAGIKSSLSNFARSLFFTIKQPSSNNFKNFVNTNMKNSHNELNILTPLTMNFLQNSVESETSVTNKSTTKSILTKEKLEESKEENILNFYQNEHQGFLHNKINSTKNFIIHENRDLQHSFPKQRTDNISTIFHTTLDKENNTPIKSSRQEEVLKNHYNYKSEVVEIVHKKNSLKTKKLETSSTIENKHMDTQESHVLNTPLIIKDGVEVINNDKKENLSIMNELETKLIQQVSHEVMEKVEAMWNHEIMRRGGSYGI